eukprot:384662_1
MVDMVARRKAIQIILLLIIIIILSLRINYFLVSIDRINMEIRTSTFDISSLMSDCHINNTNIKKCGNKKGQYRCLNILIVSIHDGARLDLPTILSSMGHNVILHSSKQYRKPYSIAFQKYNLTISPLKEISPFFQLYPGKVTSISDSVIMNHYNFYIQNRYILNNIDVISCSFPSGSLCQLWIPFNKSIFINSGHRYDHYNFDSLNVNKWNKLNRNLKTLLKINKYVNYSKHIISGNNWYDNYYINYYLNDNDEYKDYFIKSWIPTLGTLYTQLYLNNLTINYTLFHTNPTDNNTINEFLIGPSNIKNKMKNIIKNMRKYFFERQNDKKYKLIEIHEKYKHYESYDLIKHPAIILLPYAVHSYGITDIYSLNIPIFVPTIKFLYTYHMMKDVGNEQQFKKPKAINNTYIDQNYYEPLQHWNSHKNFKQFEFWISKADFNKWPHFVYFNSYKHLYNLIKYKLKYPDDYIEISNKMKRFNEFKMKYIKCKLSASLIPIQKHSTPKLPNVSYHDAIKQIFHNDLIQAIF